MGSWAWGFFNNLHTGLLEQYPACPDQPYSLSHLGAGEGIGIQCDLLVAGGSPINWSPNFQYITCPFVILVSEMSGRVITG